MKFDNFSYSKYKDQPYKFSKLTKIHIDIIVFHELNSNKMIYY